MRGDTPGRQGQITILAGFITCDKPNGAQGDAQAGREWEWERKVRVSRIEDDAGSNDSRGRNVISPESKDQVEGRDLKRNEQRLVEEEVPADSEAEGLVDPLASHTNETAGDRVQSGHLSHAVVHETEGAAVDEVGEEERAGPASVQALADADEEGGTDGATDGDKLDLAVGQLAVQAVGVAIDDLARVDVGHAIGRGLDVVVLLRLFVVGGTHGYGGTSCEATLDRVRPR